MESTAIIISFIWINRHPIHQLGYKQSCDQPLSYNTETRASLVGNRSVLDTEPTNGPTGGYTLVLCPAGARFYDTANTIPYLHEHYTQLRYRPSPLATA